MNPFVRALTLGLTIFILVETVLAQSAAGSAGPQRLHPAPEVERGPRQQRKIARTFDSGGGSEDLAPLLRVLKHEDLIATFFLTGKWAGE